MTYLVKVRRGKPPVAAEEVAVRYREKRRPIRTLSADRSPFAQLVENDGWDRSRVTVRPTGDPKPVEGSGLRATHYIAGPVEFTAAGIKTVLRRMRPEEAAALAAIDAVIAEHQEAIRELRRRRAEVTAEAWGKAHVVRINELDPKEAY